MIFALAGAAHARAAAQTACASAGAEQAAVISVDARLEVTLRDGRILRLAGFEPVRPTPDNPDFDAGAGTALAGVIGAKLDFLALARPDRWGRIPVFAFLPAAVPGTPPQSLAAWLLTRGYGRFMPEPEALSCRAAFLAAEAAARTARRGLWSDPYYAVIAATETAAFAEKAATNVIVEGQVSDIDVRPKRIYLLFGPRGSGGFAVTIMQRDVKIFDRAGFDFHALNGQRIRVRGLLDLRFGPQIEVSDPSPIEIVPPPEAVAGAGQHVEAKAVDPSGKPQ